MKLTPWQCAVSSVKRPFSEAKSRKYSNISRRSSNGRICRLRQLDLAGDKVIFKKRSSEKQRSFERKIAAFTILSYWLRKQQQFNSYDIVQGWYNISI